jgi:hypothetical protein
MWWRLMQFSVAVAVVGSNGAYHWTDNRYVAGVLAFVAALLATVLVASILDLFRLLRSRKQLSSKQPPSLRT